MRLFTNWCYGALLLLPELPDFQANHAWISKRLGHNLLPSQIESALALMEDIRVIERFPDGRYRQLEQSYESPSQVQVAIVRRWHSQLMDLAKVAIEKQSMGERFFMGTTMTFDVSRIIEVQEYLDSVRRDFEEKFSTGQKSEIYQLSLQFFRLTEKR